MSSPETPAKTDLPGLTATDSNSGAEPVGDDYDRRYYLHGLGLPYVESEPHWKRFFGEVADGIIRQLSPGTVLDAGCATGFLVAALAERGVDSSGVDISTYAVEHAVSGAEGRLQVRTLGETLGGPWDLITCIEVLEHLPVSDVQTAIDNICSATDRIVFSSTPHDFAEASHVSVKPTAIWVEWFGERGFFRGTDLDLSYLSPWALVLERRSLSPAQVAHAYETELEPLREEVVAKRAELLAASRRLGELETALRGGRGLLSDHDPAFISADRVLGLLDQIIGLRAELAEAKYQQDRTLRVARAEMRRSMQEAQDRALASEQRVEEVLSSRSWRLGQAVIRPARGLGRVLRRASG